MITLLQNWKTTLAGTGMLLGAIAHLLTALSNGDTSTIWHDYLAIIAGWGLIAAKDAKP